MFPVSWRSDGGKTVWDCAIERRWRQVKPSRTWELFSVGTCSGWEQWRNLMKTERHYSKYKDIEHLSSSLRSAQISTWFSIPTKQRAKIHPDFFVHPQPQYLSSYSPSSTSHPQNLTATIIPVQCTTFQPHFFLHIFLPYILIPQVIVTTWSLPITWSHLVISQDEKTRD